MSDSSRRRIHKGEESTDINISPMIDMVFILLIFFIVTTVFVEEEGIGVDKPTPSSEPQQQSDDEPIMLKVTVANQVLYKGTSISLNRVETVVKNALSKNDELPVIMQVERGALSGTMIKVMDRAKLGGADKISVTAIDSSS
jgi:biopolymer transport protein ExbD